MNDFGITDIKDEKFDPAQSREMTLLIKIAPKRISYAIVNERDSRLLVFYDSPVSNSVEETINKLLVKNDYLRLPFRGVKVSVHTSNFMFVPAQYYTQGDLQDYERIIQANEETKTFISSIYEDSIKCISTLELKMIAPFISAFPEVRFLSQAVPVVEAALKIQQSNAQKLILQFNDSSFEACLSAGNKFIFYNVFPIEAADDFNYFLLLLMQQLEIGRSDTSVILAGNIVEGDENYQRLEKYFTSIRFAENTAIATVSDAFNAAPKHRYFSLISLLLCE